MFLSSEFAPDRTKLAKISAFLLNAERCSGTS